MIIKKFTGKTEEEATEAARKELGSAAVIMNVRSVKRKGLAGLFGLRHIEVTAAMEEESDMQRSMALKPVRQSTGEAVNDAKASAINDKISGGNNISTEDRLSIEKRLDSLQTLLMERFQQSEAEEKEDAVQVYGTDSGERGYPPAEKEEASEEKHEPTEQERFLRLLYNTMLESEVDEKYANQIVDDFDDAQKPNLPIDYILENVYQKMILKFGRAEGITPAENGPRTVLFMGPTGVGKTTTIAKIASTFAMEEKKKVALLTADTYRIAAVEQLRTYANIMEVPFRVIYTEEEAQAAIDEFKDYDYIFMDTAGHSHQNEEQLEHMKRLIAVVDEAGESQAFLVLSVTTKYRDLLKIATSYKEVADYQLIFTKLDETATWGNMLNLKLFTDTPIAYVTYGQNVPSDIEQFNPQKTVKQILSTNFL